MLVYCDPIKPLTLENDACEYDTASALLRGGRPIAFTSRSLSECERRYAQIEKVILASLKNVPEKFHHYTFGKQSFVVIDHKSTSVTNHSARLPHISASILGESILKCGSLNHNDGIPIVRQPNRDFCFNLAREYPQWVFADYASQDLPHQESE